MNRPFDTDIRIIPDNPSFIFRVVFFSAFIQHFSKVTQDYKAMGKSRRDVKHAVIIF